MLIIYLFLCFPSIESIDLILFRFCIASLSSLVIKPHSIPKLLAHRLAPECSLDSVSDHELARSCCPPHLSSSWVRPAPDSWHWRTQGSESSSHPAIGSTSRSRPNAEPLCKNCRPPPTDEKSHRCNQCLLKPVENTETRRPPVR